ncbi:MAG TPA: peptide chain release factor N(5)-glutamine methyltransferase [Aeromicrobium sp.]|nr:peptide chain release factor N(5)-glutamine methyltransferase [Aeromicrobium sp.]
MNPKQLLEEAVKTLEAGGVESARNDAEILLSHVLGVPRALVALTARPQPDQLAVFLKMIDARAARTPLQHLTGRAGFRYVDLEVGPGVFVPRPETEVLAGWATEAARAVGGAPKVVDLCTGSGAIALSVVHEVPSAQVYAVELDELACGWAQRNLLGTGVDLRQGDAADAFPDLDGAVDVVVANPPYIPLDAWESVAVEARDHDPALALWSGDDGLDAIRAIERTAWRLLKPGGVVGIEHADVQGTSAPALFSESEHSWRDVRDNPDLAGRPRFTTARKP